MRTNYMVLILRLNYSSTETEILSVNNLPFVDQSVNVPIGFIPGSTETHTIKASGVENFDETVIVSLEDIKESITINLRADSVYTYFASPGDDPNRFILHIDANTVDIEQFDRPNEILIYLSDRNIVVENTQGNILTGEIKVFDLLGRLQFVEDLGRSTKQTFEPFLRSGTYIAMICNKTEIQTKKLIIK